MPDESGCLTEDEYVIVGDDSSNATDVSEDDTEDDAEGAEGMFDMFSHQLSVAPLSTDDRLDLNAYHEELEREFGEGLAVRDILSDDLAARRRGANAVADPAVDTPLDGPAESENVQEQRALLACFENHTMPGQTPYSSDTPFRKLPHGTFGASSRPLPGPSSIARGVARAKNKMADLIVDQKDQAPRQSFYDLMHASSSRLSSDSGNHARKQASAWEWEDVPKDAPKGESPPQSITLDRVQDQVFAYGTTPTVRAIPDLLTKPFTYTPLVEPGLIRVLEIMPAVSLDGPIECRMHTIPLPAQRDLYSHPFQTVSYAWGATYTDGSHLTDVIWCNGETLRITANLHAALIMIRGHLDAGRLTIYGKRPYLWADAICMNLVDLEERNHQVDLMAQIYNRSARVIVSLGPASQTEDRLLAKALDGVQDTAHNNAGNHLEKSLPALVESILQRPWFHRRWCIPEFALQGIRTILFGRYAFDAGHFVRLVERVGLSHIAGPLRYTKLWDGLLTRRWLLANLHRFSGAQCSLPQDLVYALKSISCLCGDARSRCGVPDCGANTPSDLPVDYRLSVEELFTIVARQFVTRDVTAVLACACLRPRRRSTGSRPLPSWVPDWRQEFSCDPPQLKKFIDDCFEDYDVSDETASFCYQRTPGIYEPMGRTRTRGTVSVNLAHNVASSSTVLTVDGWLFQRHVAPGMAAAEDCAYMQQLVPGRKIGTAQGSGSFYEDELRGVRPSSYIVDQGSPVTAKESFLGEWPLVDQSQVVMFIPWSRLGFVLRRSSETEFSLCSCFRRPIVLGNLRFLLIASDSGRKWMEGNLKIPKQTIKLV